MQPLRMDFLTIFYEFIFVYPLAYYGFIEQGI